MIGRLFKGQKEYNDTGFGSKVSVQADRFINRDGSFNVEKRGVPFFDKFSYYNALITMPTWLFLLVILGAYLVLNLIYATIYYSIGVEHLQNVSADTEFGNFLEAFYFSAQTFTTVGYGRVNPDNTAANMVAVLESLNGLLAFALATGLIYGRFSRPVAKLLFSRNILVAPYQDHSALMFRLANAKTNQLVDLKIQVFASFIDKENGGVRRFYDLNLERNKINFLPLSWTIVHPLNDDSPLGRFDQQAMEDRDLEIMISISGLDDTFIQTVHARSSYKHHEMVWGAKFSNIFDRTSGGKTSIRLNQLSTHEPATLP